MEEKKAKKKVSKKVEAKKESKQELKEESKKERKEVKEPKKAFISNEEIFRELRASGDSVIIGGLEFSIKRIKGKEVILERKDMK